MTKLGFDLHDLELKSKHLSGLVKAKLDELEAAAPQLGVSEYIRRLSEEFQEISFDPLEDVWEDEINRLMDKFDDGEEE